MAGIAGRSAVVYAKQVNNIPFEANKVCHGRDREIHDNVHISGMNLVNKSLPF